MRLFLIRHGQTESNVNHLLDTQAPGAPLDDTGLAQAEALVERLAEHPIEAVYASHLTRAQQTAAPLAKALGVDVITLEGLREISAGVQEMNPDWTEYVAMLESWSPDNLDVGLEGGETAREFITRYREAIDLIEQDGHDVAALVSHGAALRVYGLTCAPTMARETALPLRNTEWIEMVGSTEEGWRIVHWGEGSLD